MQLKHQLEAQLGTKPKGTLCVQIFGGLGNQMFQYAAGHAVAHRLGVQLLLDPVDSSRLDHTQYGMETFNLGATVWQADQTPRRTPLLDFFRKPKAKKHFLRWPGPLYRHEGQAYDSSIESIGPGTYLMGYFQSERFFTNVADDIRAAFSLAHVTSDRDLIAALEAGPYVAVHIRRGDYANDKKTTATHGLLGAEYYELARALMDQLVPGAHYLVFSDNLHVAAQLTEHWPNRLLSPGKSREEDLRLMSLCRHHIIANSTFSWWGAWLAQAGDKRVIAPRRWFARDKMLKTFTDDIYPDGWLLV